MYEKATKRQLAFLRYNGCAFAESEYGFFLTKKEAGVLIGHFKRLQAYERIYGIGCSNPDVDAIISQVKNIQHNAMKRKQMLFN